MQDALKQDVPFRTVVNRLLLMLGIMLGLRISPYFCLFLPVLALWAFARDRSDIIMMLLLFVPAINVVNEIFFKKEVLYWTTIRATTLLLAAGLFIRSRRFKGIGTRLVAPLKGLFVYLAVMIPISLLGWLPLVSELKILLIGSFFVTLQLGSAEVMTSTTDIRNFRAALLALAMFFILGSAATIPFPAVGRSMLSIRSEWLGSEIMEKAGMFNGVTWHPQTLGPVVGLFNAFLLADMFFNLPRRHWLYVVMLLACPILVYMSSSRTALLGYLVSLVSFLLFFLQTKFVRRSRKSAVAAGVLLLFLAGSAVLMLLPQFRSNIESFVRKRSESPDRAVDGGTLLEDATNSRLSMAIDALANFRKSPWIGNGFQVKQDLQGRDYSNWRMLLSAPVEKGVLPTMILEEGGVVGATVFIGFLVTLYRGFRKRGCNCFLVTFTTLMGINCGEAVFFSSSSVGGVAWSICFGALLMDAHRIKSLQARGVAQLQAALAGLKTGDSLGPT